MKIEFNQSRGLSPLIKRFGKRMKVFELKQLLENVDDDRIVILQKDGEGNGYSPLYALDELNYKADSTYSGEVGYQELTEKLKKQGYSEADILSGDGVEPALILVPVN